MDINIFLQYRQGTKEDKMKCIILSLATSQCGLLEKNNFLAVDLRRGLWPGLRLTPGFRKSSKIFEVDYLRVNGFFIVDISW